MTPHPYSVICETLTPTTRSYLREWFPTPEEASEAQVEHKKERWQRVEMVEPETRPGERGDQSATAEERSVARMDTGTHTNEHTPEPRGWFVRLRPEGIYFGPNGAKSSGEAEGQGWATEAEALAARDTLVITYLGPGQSKDEAVNIGVGRWPVTSYSIRYYPMAE